MGVRMRRNGFVLIVLLLMVMGAGCIRKTAEEAVATPLDDVVVSPPTATVVPPTATEEPTATAVPTATITPTPTTPVVEWLDARIAVNSINMRAGPSTVHDVVAKYLEGTVIRVVARAPGAEWVKIEAPDYYSGWMLAIFLEIEGNPDHLRTVEAVDALTIGGTVVDEAGDPVDKINVAVYRRSDGNEQRTDAHTDLEGNFYAYLPLDSEGEWMASVVGIGCSSRIVDADCDYTGRFEPESQLFTLPLDEPLSFVYMKDMP